MMEGMEARFAMVFSGYDRVQKELYASEKEVTKLRLQLGVGTSPLSESGERTGEVEKQESIPEQKIEAEVVSVKQVIPHTTPSQSPQIEHHEDLESEGESYLQYQNRTQGKFLRKERHHHRKITARVRKLSPRLLVRKLVHLNHARNKRQ